MSTFEEQLKDSLSSAYDIERELGGGGMSRVFVATDRLLGRKVVIKVLSPELTAEVNRGRFRREIQVAAQLQHPHIVTLFAAGEHGDLVYYTMPFIEGESLKSALEKERRLPVPDVIRVLYDVVDALAYAHRHGVIHRDIKPGNILRSGNHALVTDFGVAKALNAAMPSTAMTSTGMAIGTPAYMAPEQLAGDPTADHRIDLYALGLLSYELLSGQSPFAAPTPQGVLAAVLTREPTPLHDVRKDVPRKLSAIIMQCLSKVPGGRPPNAEALLDALDMIATSSGEIRTREHKVPSRMKTPVAAVPAVLPIAEVLTPVTATPAVMETPLPPGERNRSRLFAGVAVLGLAVAAGGLLMSQPWKRDSSVSSEPTQIAAADKPQAGSALNFKANAPAPAVVTPIDSMAIANAIEKRLALAEAAKKGKTAVNADSLKRAVQREMSDSIARANAKRAVAQPTPAPAATTTTAPAAPTPAPTAAATPITSPAADPSPSPSGKKRLAITAPRESSVPALNSFTRSFMDALRVSLEATEGFDAIDADVVRDAQARTSSRDEAAKVLKPDVMVWPGYVGTGDTVTVIITVWDMRASSSFGIRVTSAKIAPANADHYLAPLVQSTMKQLNDLANTPTIYRRKQ